MKKLFTLALMILALSARAQWTTTTNQFFDSLHMPVSTAPSTQTNPLVLRSYPDGGWFVIWEDDRNMNTTKRDIYAQKYDENGNRLWAENGVPVANGPYQQYYRYSSSQDYRNRSIACTDSAGGFYLTYIDDSVTNYFWPRIAVQHMLSDGTMRFPGAGYIVAQTPPNELYTLGMPMLVPDGNKGFFVSWVNTLYGGGRVFVQCIKDNNGTMINYGSAVMNNNAIQRSRLNQCGVQVYIEYPGTSVIDYNIWYDGQGGCNVIMDINGNTADQYRMLAFNKMWRAKKKAVSTSYRRTASGEVCPGSTSFDSLGAYPLYTLQTDWFETKCGGSGSPLYVVRNDRVLSNGFYLLDRAYDFQFPKGITLSTNASINVDIIATGKRTLSNNSVSNQAIHCYTLLNERYDSIPYQRSSSINPDIGFNPISPPLHWLVGMRDTVLGISSVPGDFSLSGHGNNVYIAGLVSTAGSRNVLLQHLQLSRPHVDTFHLSRTTNSKQGVVIGKELSTGFSGSNIFFDQPLVSFNSAGNAMFYIRESGRGPRVSPIVNGTELAWGAMGKPIGTGLFNNSYYSLETPHAQQHPSNGSALFAFRDNRFIPGNTWENIYMMRVDSLNQTDYQPPYKPVRLVPNPYGATYANPGVLMGSSKNFTTFETYTSYASFPNTTPVVEILDNTNLGRMEVTLYQHSSTIRRYNDKPYLNRNFTIRSETQPAGTAINLRLFFTTTEWDALKVADPSLLDPADLVIIHQPFSNINAASAYAPLAGEKIIQPIAWKAVTGGYYIELVVNSFGNFFVWKGGSLQLCPNGSGSIVANLTGTTYQWQADMGSGYGNLTNNSYYAGVNTNTLQLMNIPSSWYGYKYRCVVNGVPGSETVLRFVNTWTGATNNNWEDVTNWSCGSLPDENSDVIINTGTIMVNSSPVIRSLILNPGVGLTVTPGNMTSVKF